LLTLSSSHFDPIPTWRSLRDQYGSCCGPASTDLAGGAQCFREPSQPNRPDGSIGDRLDAVTAASSRPLA
jgi:hypothetical protein